jgi:catechol 2,3-dioxygenase-like lactoylglutathione lyase family enzyme
VSNEANPRVVQINRGVEDAAGAAPEPGPRHEALGVWVGRWINQGHTVNRDGSPGMTITTSDVYEWVPGGFFVAHAAYGRVGDFGGGAVEVIGWDDSSGEYRSHVFDSAGNVVVSRLVASGDTWTYYGDTTRATVQFSADAHVQTVLHERTDDGTTYQAAMRVTLTKVD